jgi:hypothetical protein
MWPAAIVGLTLYGIKLASPESLLAVIAAAAFACLLYIALFILAIGRHDRNEYFAKLMTIMGRGNRLVPVS